MTNHGAGYGARLCNDKELRHVDYTCEKSGLERVKLAGVACIYEWHKLGSMTNGVRPA